MAEEFNIIIEHLRELRAGQDRLEERMTFMQEDMRGIKQHIAALVSAEGRQDGDLASVRERLDRIETRLGLVDSTH